MTFGIVLAAAAAGAGAGSARAAESLSDSYVFGEGRASQHILFRFRQELYVPEYSRVDGSILIVGGQVVAADPRVPRLEVPNCVLRLAQGAPSRGAGFELRSARTEHEPRRGWSSITFTAREHSGGALRTMTCRQPGGPFRGYELKRILGDRAEIFRSDSVTGDDLDCLRSAYEAGAVERIALWARDFDRLGDALLATPGDGGYSTAFGSGIDASCLAGPRGTTRYQTIEKVEAALAYASGQSERCQRRFGFAELAAVVGKLRRSVVSCAGASTSGVLVIPAARLDALSIADLAELMTRHALGAGPSAAPDGACAAAHEVRTLISATCFPLSGPGQGFVAGAVSGECGAPCEAALAGLGPGPARAHRCRQLTDASVRYRELERQRGTLASKIPALREYLRGRLPAMDAEDLERKVTRGLDAALRAFSPMADLTSERAVLERAATDADAVVASICRPPVPGPRARFCQTIPSPAQSELRRWIALTGALSELDLLLMVEPGREGK